MSTIKCPYCNCNNSVGLVSVKADVSEDNRLIEGNSKIGLCNDCELLFRIQD
ncbi:hypothetical protein [Bacillus sp. SM2101]|uniref:hypothetical protein n=1 Tax=Bacillus sp. SM2101 TaxID=2805366 RepID=UPI001BDF3801|nr:hypothetical protein [Bacillus sp. SM2101]